MERPPGAEPPFTLTVLAHLNRTGSMTPGALAAAERVQPQSLTRTLNRLEAEQLITREPDPADGRRSLLVLTDRGLTALRDDMRVRDRWLAASIADQLTAVERQLLLAAVQLIDQLAEANPHLP
jgi:DNA-binding MarR family transcriptional regulator